jgi:hypothetical protein
MNDIGPTDGMGELCMAAHPSNFAAKIGSHLLIYAQDSTQRRRAWGLRSFDRPAALFDRLRELDDQGRPRALVVLFPQFDAERENWNRPEEYEQARALAEERGLPVVDLKELWRTSGIDDVTPLFVDRTHLSEAGHRDVAARMAPAVIQRFD